MKNHRHIGFSYIIPTRNREDELNRTLEALGSLDLEDAEVIVLDNQSDRRIDLPSSLSSGVPVRTQRMNSNLGAAARTFGAELARGRWLVMLDDDSVPLDNHHQDVAASAAGYVAAIGAEIVLPDGRHEAGGLPEVFVGCGVMIRRDAFLRAGGYDKAFGYYAEEYDLAARLLLEGWHVSHDTRFRVFHRKVRDGRDMDAILHRLIRNNGWVDLRYCPDHLLSKALACTAARYRRIAADERAMRGYRAGLAELAKTADTQPRRPMPEHLYDRFTGLAHARPAARRIARETRGKTVSLVHEGKNAWAIRSALEEAGCVIVQEDHAGEVLVIATLSPGPALDALRERCDRPVKAVWVPDTCEAERAA